MTGLIAVVLIAGCTGGDLEAENPLGPAPTGPLVSAVSEFVSGTYTGTHTIELGEPPGDATHVRTDVTCLSPGTLTLDDGSVLICPTASAATSSMTSYRSLVATASLQRRTPKSIMSRRALWEQVEVIRDRGWSVDDEENEPHIRCVGAVLPDGNGRIVGGVSCSGLDHEMTRERIAQIAPLVLATIMDIE